MSYKDSYIWKLRQKVNDMTIMTVTVDVLPIRDDGKIKLIFSKIFNYWSTIGGHPEINDSWNSAMIRELEEEAGIIARKEDLGLFTTISGPNRIYHFKDGDSRPFTNVYLIRKWSEERDFTDKDEISETKWVSVEEAKQLKLNGSTRKIKNAYENYLKIGKVQVIEE